MSKRFLVDLIYPIDYEINKFLRDSKVKIVEYIDEETIIIEISEEVLRGLQVKRIVYFREVEEIVMTKE